MEHDKHNGRDSSASTTTSVHAGVKSDICNCLVYLSTRFSVKHSQELDWLHAWKSAYKLNYFVYHVHGALDLNSLGQIK